MGTFSPEQQVFMAVGRSSIVWDQLTCSPWSETDKELASHAITCAKESMKMMGTFMDDQDFIEMNPANFFKTPATMDMTVKLFFNKAMNLGGIYICELLHQEDPNIHKHLFSLMMKHCQGIMSFDYIDMSDDALCGPPIAAMAFVGIVLLHELKKMSGLEQKFNEICYSESWVCYVHAFINHPQLGLIRAMVLEKMKHKYCEVYEEHHIVGLTGPCLWKWREDLHF
ncbi:hypothetical protein FRC11_000568 [Ceratobasidium sp. 423]|nr:hypothetical protein FRC11_000568 [Ceratobasidium sp. 423]